MLPKPGTKAPDFLLPDETGMVHRLSDYLGKTFLLYFYPKDDTAGCTTEACNFRNDYGEYQKASVVILGVSPDSQKSHVKFKEKYHLPFPLLSDEGHKVCDAYGVWGPKEMMGRKYEGVYRTTFLIGPDGLIKRVFENVKPDCHSKEILEGLKK